MSCRSSNPGTGFQAVGSKISEVPSRAGTSGLALGQADARADHRQLHGEPGPGGDGLGVGGLAGLDGHVDVGRVDAEERDGGEGAAEALLLRVALEEQDARPPPRPPAATRFQNFGLGDDFGMIFTNGAGATTWAMPMASRPLPTRMRRFR